MAKSVLNINSTLNFHPNYAGDNCSLCGSRNRLTFAVQFDYATERVIDWREAEDYSTHGEAYVCWSCADRFDPDALLEA